MLKCDQRSRLCYWLLCLSLALVAMGAIAADVAQERAPASVPAPTDDTAKAAIFELIDTAAARRDLSYSESLETYLDYTGQVDAEGRKFGTNTDTDGRFHSKWLSMMYPRLYLARNLLREDGLIFRTIDDSLIAASSAAWEKGGLKCSPFKVI